MARLRDVGRIMDAVRDAHLTQIDSLILTHYHGDQFRRMEELSKQIPIKEFIAHGRMCSRASAADWERDSIPSSMQGKHIVAKAGTALRLKVWTGASWPRPAR